MHRQLTSAHSVNGELGLLSSCSAYLARIYIYIHTQSNAPPAYIPCGVGEPVIVPQTESSFAYDIRGSFIIFSVYTLYFCFVLLSFIHLQFIYTCALSRYYYYFSNSFSVSPFHLFLHVQILLWQKHICCQ